ncbi:PEBP-like protein [Xylariomycetidae sp. FL2044]|nr:PEBP-like protein [Xylariomycetidae sp. FL2044]
MLSKSPILLAAAAASSLTLAATPENFEPAADTSLLVSYGSIAAMDGTVVAKAVTQTAPTIGTQSQLEGTSFAVMMIDLDIPTNNPPETGTLLHWMQTGLTQSATATTMNTTMGAVSGFMFDTAASADDALAEYLGPSPPARIPLSHRYTQVLVDTSSLTDEGLSVLEEAAQTRMGFDTMAVLTEAGLADKVLAGNFFNVTNAGPAQNANATTGSGSGSGTGSSAGTTGTNTVTSPTTSQTSVVPAAAALNERASGLFLAITMVGAVFLTL